MKKKNIILIIFGLLFNNLIVAQNNPEITLTIDSMPKTISSAEFDNAEKLRSEFKFDEAINAYKKVLNSKEVTKIKSEAAYNIGLCYTWKNDFKNVKLYFNKVISEFKDNSLAVSFAKYGLSWVKVQEGKYYDAIEILENELKSKNCDDYEHNAVMIFKIGKIYQKYLSDFEKAKEYFNRVKTNYPNAKIMSHPFLSNTIKNIQK